MFRLILVIIFFLIALLTVFPAPFHLAWLIAVAVSAYSCAFLIITFLLLAWSNYSKKYRMIGVVLSTLAFILYFSPIIRAYYAGRFLDQNIQNAFGIAPNDIKGFHQRSPFGFWKMFSGNDTRRTSSVIYKYASPAGVDLALKFYPSLVPGVRPCLVVVHGGSWHNSSYNELREADNYFANAGYQVASINYRLAPQFKSPAPLEDLRSAISWLCSQSKMLKIDTTNFVLMGRSAGGQIVLTAAYTLNNPNIKGVASYYGPTDMIWSYENPANALIINSKKIQEDYLGGTPQQAHQAYMDASAINHVSASTVPTLLIHGILDAHVSVIQTYRLAKLLDSVKVKNMVLEIPWGTHGCEYNLTCPSGQLCVYTTERFFYAVTHK